MRHEGSANNLTKSFEEENAMHIEYILKLERRALRDCGALLDNAREEFGRTEFSLEIRERLARRLMKTVRECRSSLMITWPGEE